MTAEPLDVLDALHSTPARRYLAPDPIPDAVLWSILDAAIRGPSGGNAQSWGWVVVTDIEVKKPVAEWYRENWHLAYGRRREEFLSTTQRTDGLTAQGFRGAEHLAHHLEEAPVWVFAVLRHAASATDPRTGASIYGAVQNLCLAARAHGVGTSLTTLYGGHEEELRELLGLPSDALTMALVPMGYPLRGRWAEPKRKPVDQVVHWNRWERLRPRDGERDGQRPTYPRSVPTRGTGCCHLTGSATGGITRPRSTARPGSSCWPGSFPRRQLPAESRSRGQSSALRHRIVGCVEIQTTC